MFDVGFSELLLLGVVALIVLGPERLPIAMRNIGRYYAKFRNLMSNVQDTVNQELKLIELREQMQKELENIRQTELKMKEELAKISLQMQNFDFTKGKANSPTNFNEDDAVNCIFEKETSDRCQKTPQVQNNIYGGDPIDGAK